jgi:hypothetical protein
MSERFGPFRCVGGPWDGQMRFSQGGVCDLYGPMQSSLERVGVPSEGNELEIAPTVELVHYKMVVFRTARERLVRIWVPATQTIDDTESLLMSSEFQEGVWYRESR